MCKGKEKPPVVIGVTARFGGMCDVAAMFRRRWPVASKILIGIALLLGALAFVVVRGYQDRVEAAHPAVGPGYHPAEGLTRIHPEPLHRSPG